MTQKYRLTLDKVERKKCEELKELIPQYEDLELDEIAHWELKTVLLQKTAEVKNMWKTEKLKKNLRNQNSVIPPKLNGEDFLYYDSEEFYCEINGVFLHLKKKNSNKKQIIYSDF